MIIVIINNYTVILVGDKGKEVFMGTNEAYGLALCFPFRKFPLGI